MVVDGVDGVVVGDVEVREARRMRNGDALVME